MVLSSNCILVIEIVSHAKPIDESHYINDLKTSNYKLQLQPAITKQRSIPSG